MNSYTITIAPNDDSGHTTTLIVDTSGDEVIITDVHLHASGGLVGGQMPSVDFALLLRAVAAPAAPTQISAAPVDAPVVADRAAGADEAADTEHRVEGVVEADGVVDGALDGAGVIDLAAADDASPAVEDPAADDRAAEDPTPAPGARRTRRGAAKATPAGTASAEPVRARARRATTAAKPTEAGKAAKGKVAKGRAGKGQVAKGQVANGKAAADVAATGGGRSYRRMPEDLATVYRQAGTSAAIAEHYGVPRHTAQGWLRRLGRTTAAGTPAGAQ